MPNEPRFRLGITVRIGITAWMHHGAKWVSADENSTVGWAEVSGPK